MEYVELLDFLARFSLPTIIISVIAGICKILCDVFLTKKLGAGVLSLIPFAVSGGLYFAYDCIFVARGFSFGEQTLSAGIIGGSIACLISALFDRIRRGKLNYGTDEISLMLEGALKNYVKTDSLLTAVVTVKELIETALKLGEYDRNALVNDIARAVKEFAKDGITEEEITLIATLAVKGAEQLKNE